MGCSGLAEGRSIAFLVLYYKPIDHWAFEIMRLRGFSTLQTPSHTFFTLETSTHMHIILLINDHIYGSIFN